MCHKNKKIHILTCGRKNYGTIKKYFFHKGVYFFWMIFCDS